MDISVSPFLHPGPQFVIFKFHERVKNRVFPCESSVVYSADTFTILRKHIHTPTLDFDIFLIYSEVRLLQGFVFINNLKYDIESYFLYDSLTVHNVPYHHIAICKLTIDIDF